MLNKQLRFLLGSATLFVLVVSLLTGTAIHAEASESMHTYLSPITPLSGGTLRFPLVGSLSTLDPAQWSLALANETVIELQIFEGLTQLDQNSNIIPAIASSWSSPDAIVWTFNLRNDVYFHNGRQVKAGDFYYSWNRAQNAGGTYAFMFDDIASYSIPDDFTFVVTLKDPSATFPSLITMPIFAVIPSEAANTIGSIPVGTGPFKFKSWTTSKIILQQSPNYWDTPAYLDSIEFKFYADIDAEWSDFQASKLDLSPIPAGQWGTVKADPNVITGGTMLMQAYGFDTVFFPDVAVRKALQQAINRSAIASNPVIWPYDPLPVANGVVSPGKGNYDNSDITIAYDPTAALNQLAAAGWADTNADGILDNGTGSNLNIIVKDSSPTSTGGHARAMAIANDLANIGGTGIGANVSMSTDNNIATFKQVGWISDYPAPDGDLYPYETGGVFATRINYSSTTFNDHLSAALETLDETARNAEFHAADVQLVQTDAAVLPLYYGSMIPVLKKTNVHDLMFNTQGYANILLKHAWLELPGCIPTLVLPEEAAVLDNGRDDGLDQEVWDFDWSQCPNATKYQLYVYHAGAVYPLIDDNAITGTSFHTVSNGYIADGDRLNWTWQVKAYVNGQWGNWSEKRTFEVEPLNSDSPNIKPSSTPALNLPANGSLTKDYTPRLDWLASTPLPDHYEVQLSLDSDFIVKLYDETIPGAIHEYTLPADLTPNIKYYWRVRAVNADNETSAWSATWNYRTAILPPVLTTPDTAINLTHRRPFFNWEDVEGSTGYKIVISKYANLSSPITNVAVATSEFFPATDLPAKSVLYWRVQATGPNGPSQWSETRSFKTGNPPSVPLLVSPANNALVKVYTPTLKWGKSSLPSGTTFRRYELQVDDNNDFSSPEIGINTSDGLITETSYTPPADLNPNTRYYWRVRAVNLVGAEEHISSWSAVRSFRTVMLPPVLLLPADGSTEVTLKPPFDWDEVVGATSYTIQISTSASFGTFLVNTKVTVSNFTPSTNLPKNKVIYWRVRANGPNGPSAWSKFQFTTPQ